MKISRSEQKRRVKELEALVHQLVTLPVSVQGKAPCTVEVLELIKETATLKGGARKRQIKYITKILKTEPTDELYGFLTRQRGAALVKNKMLHEIEYLRDTLLNEAIEQRRICAENHADFSEHWPSDTVKEILNKYPQADDSTMKRLSFLFARTRSIKHSRELFKYLRSVQEQHQAS